MVEPLYYRLAEVEELLSYSRDTVGRFIAAGLLIAQGSGKGRRVTAASVRALEQRLAAGEDVWQIVRARTKAANAATEPRPTVKVRSIKIKRASGGTSRRNKTDDDPAESAALTAKPPNWLKPII